MTTRLTAALTAVRRVAERTDPLEPVSVGTIASDLGISLSAASRMCADLEQCGLLGRAEHYGAYRIGPRAIRMSGRAAAPTAHQVRLALTRAAQHTGETVCIAARSGGGLRVISAIESAWTLYAPAELGEAVDDPACALALAADATIDTPRSHRATVFESASGMSIELATPMRDLAGRTVAVLGVRLPSNRLRAGAARARTALDAARLQIEAALDAETVRDAGAARDAGARDVVETDAPPPVSELAGQRSLETAARILDHLADGPDTVARMSRMLGLRADRTQRLVASCVAAGLLEPGVDDGVLRVTWSMHGWHRAASTPILVGVAAPLVAATSAETGECAFLTTLRGMRSVTLVEELAEQPDGLAMIPWLGRPCPIVYADGGPTLLMDFEVDDIAPLVPGHPPQADLDELLDRMRRVVERDVLAKESAEEGGQIAVSAPVRDAAGLVVAAACIVGPSDLVRPRVRELEAAAIRLAADASLLLSGRGAGRVPQHEGARQHLGRR